MSHRIRSSRFIALAVAAALMACGGRAKLDDVDNTKASPDPNTATSDQWSGQNAAQAEELFAGRFSGVQVFRIQGGVAVRIRGSTSLMGSNEPLYVIDGMTIEPGEGGALVGINPADIAKIEVLKDIGSTSLYGGRGANGVIVITTKRGK